LFVLFDIRPESLAQQAIRTAADEYE